MTKYLLTVVLFFTLSGCMTTYKTLPADQHSVIKVYKVDLNKSSLYSLIQQWFATNLGKSNEAIQIQDKEAGILLGKMIAPGGFQDSIGVSHDLQMNIKVQIKVAFRDVVSLNHGV